MWSRPGKCWLKSIHAARSQAEAASQSQVRETQANLANAKAKYERNQRLFEQKFISRAALDQTESEFPPRRRRRPAAIANAGMSATSKSFTTIVAPYGGIVAATQVEVGDMATMGRPLSPCSIRANCG